MLMYIAEGAALVRPQLQGILKDMAFEIREMAGYP
jgi:hypothetical protein